MAFEYLGVWGDSAYSVSGLPYVKFRFAIQIDGIGNIGFNEVSGLKYQMDPYLYREGGNNLTELKLQGDISYPDVVFRRGITDDYSVWNWVYSSTQLESNLIVKAHYRRNISIVLLGKDKKPKRMWTIYGALPVGYEIDTLNAEASETAFETLSVAHQGIDGIPIIF